MELSILWKRGYSQKDIAVTLGVSPSSISRELRRNSSQKGIYNFRNAQHKAYVRRKYSKFEGMKIRNVEGLEGYIKEKLLSDWTPEQISGRLKQESGETVISFKSIYKWVYTVWGQQFADCMPSKRKKPKRRKKKKQKFELIKGRIFIEKRPEIINKRSRLGDFEGDTLGKPRNTSGVLTGIIDRKSRYFFARKVKSLKDSMQDGFKKILPAKAKSITLDNGVENIHYKILETDTYFCRPYSSWQKGAIENTFQRLRRFIPKKADLKNYSQENIDLIVKRMNNTPRKCLGFKTPAEVFKDHFP